MQGGKLFLTYVNTKASVPDWTAPSKKELRLLYILASPALEHDIQVHCAHLPQASKRPQSVEVHTWEDVVGQVWKWNTFQ